MFDLSTNVIILKNYLHYLYFTLLSISLYIGIETSQGLKFLLKAYTESILLAEICLKAQNLSSLPANIIQVS